MSELKVSPVVLNKIVVYFEDPKHHLDKDTKHISKKEFNSAIGKISPEADQFLQALVYSNNAYNELKEMQTEKTFLGLPLNDQQVSMQDLYGANCFHYFEAALGGYKFPDSVDWHFSDPKVSKKPVDVDQF